MDKKELGILKESADSFDYKGLDKIPDNTAYSKAAQDLLAVKEFRKRAESLTKPFVEAAYESHKKSKDWQNTIVNPFKEIEKKIKQLIKDYEDDIARQAAIESKKGNEGCARALVGVVESIRPKGLGIRRVWQANIIDVSLIPRKYMLPDITMLNALGRISKGKEVVPGVEFVYE